MTISKPKPRILSLLGCYWPGNEATGPAQSFAAFSAGLHTDVDIRVVAKDPNGDAPQGWQEGATSTRAQLPIGPFGARGLLGLLRETPHDVLLLNGFHDRAFTIPALVYRKLGLIPARPTILSPRGEFADGARSLKARKKRIFLRAVHLTELTQDVWLHATAEHEKNDIEAIGLSCRGILQAPNMRQLPDLPHIRPPEGGALHIAFLGRVSPVKNLEFAIKVLSEVKAPVCFNIYGPQVDPEYWKRLQVLISKLPSHITVTAHGTVPHDQVAQTLAAHDLFFLPTLGENFGHAINEALSAGVPALIADTTPWRGLQASQAGWDLALSRPDLFRGAIDEMAQKTTEERAVMRSAARQFAQKSFSDSDALAANLRMLHRVMDIDVGLSDDDKAFCI